ncbi:MAG: methylglyoxal synthase [Leptospiraceae bacterium]|nr:methylglyoxal synthase [Leptospiraceae bacterium]
MEKSKRIVLIAHDNKKRDLLEWISYNKGTLSKHFLSATGTTGRLIQEETELPVQKFISGPLGGDQQIGAKIVSGEIDLMIFFWDPLSAQPHDPDVKALLRIAVLYNIPMACNRSTADFLISSSLLDSIYDKKENDYSTYISRVV